MIQEANLIWRYEDTQSGLIMPWFTLPCLEWLLKQEVNSWKVMEYGAGYSTIWFRANCQKLESIDSNARWATAVGAFNYEGSSPEIYIEACAKKDFFWDCIIIDGIQREKCAAFATNHLKSGGYLIIDNYGQEDYNPEINAGLFKNWPIQLFKQPNHSTWQTAVLTKP